MEQTDLMLSLSDLLQKDKETEQILFRIYKECLLSADSLEEAQLMFAEAVLSEVVSSDTKQK